MDRAEFLRHHQRIAVIEPLAAELDGLVEAEKAEIAELLEQLMRGELLGLLPFIDEGIDFGRDEFLQGVAGVVVVCGEEHFSIHSGIPGARLSSPLPSRARGGSARVRGVGGGGAVREFTGSRVR